MLQFAMTGRHPQPMPARDNPWALYDVFTVKDGEQIFLAVVSDTQWAIFCDAFALGDLKGDARLATNNDRVRARDWMMPPLRQRLAMHTANELAAAFERNGLPYAPITRPQDLFDDPHLLATGGLAAMKVPPSASGTGRAIETRTPLLPLTLAGARPPLRGGPPALGEHNVEVLRGLGYGDPDIERLRADGVVAGVVDGESSATEAASA
jgi:crotonobetainyl-CoA:carnitine CoA-transferase CaiB-like acyl-CoA transferase